MNESTNEKPLWYEENKHMSDEMHRFIETSHWLQTFQDWISYSAVNYRFSIEGNLNLSNDVIIRRVMLKAFIYNVFHMSEFERDLLPVFKLMIFKLSPSRCDLNPTFTFIVWWNLYNNGIIYVLPYGCFKFFKIHELVDEYHVKFDVFEVFVNLLLRFTGLECSRVHTFF